MQLMNIFTCALTLLSISAVDAGQCCFSGPNDCDSEHSFCSKDSKHCVDCGGSYTQTNREAMACEGTGMCCYSDAKDCDMGKHYCSSSADNCLDCGGDYMCVKAEEKAESKSEADDVTVSHSHPMAQPVMLAASAPAEKPVMLASAAGKCCYSGPKDCDSERDWCSKDATHCDKCTGTFYNATDLDLAETPPVMLAAMPPSAPSADPVVLASVPGKCCYSGPKDCDSERDWCSKDAAHCGRCKGTFYNATDLDLAETPPLMLAAMPPNAPSADPVMLASAAGKCCYSGPKDCDSERDWCSKDATHCDKCKGTFYNATDLDLAEVAKPLMLAAEVPKVPNKEAAGHCCYSSRNDCDGSKDWCSKDEAHCTQCGGTFHANEEVAPAAPSKDVAAAQMAALPLELAAAPDAHMQQEHSPAQQGGDWERYIPKEYRSFFKSKMQDSHRHAPRNQTEASSAKASAFLGAQKESLASDPLSLPVLACLSVVGLALMMKAIVRANRRTVNLQTEVLG